MNDRVSIRLARSLVERVLDDLRRPHPFAAERVCFLFARRGSGPPGVAFLFPIDYLAVPDDQYIDGLGLWEGAAINGNAIRSAMERVMTMKLSALHVHLHDHPGRPHFSRTDWRDLPDFARTFQHANPTLMHGGIVLSHDAAAGAVWLPNEASGEPVLPRISIVGYTLRIEGSDSHDACVARDSREEGEARDDGGSL